MDDEWVKRFAISARGGAELMEFPGNYKDIPIVAIRETLANAIVHRDYTTNSSRVQ